MPFFIAWLLAYLMQPLARFLCTKTHLSRQNIALFISLTTIIIICAAIYILIPILYEQIAVVIKKLPQYQTTLSNKIITINSYVGNDYVKSLIEQLQLKTLEVLDILFSSSLQTLSNIWIYTLNTVKFFITLVILPIILFYFIKDWQVITAGFFALFPKKDQKHVMNLLNDVDNFLYSYLRGQMALCFWMILLYTAVLNILQIDFPFLLGLISGLVIIIPFVGTIFSVSLALLITYLSYGISSKLLYVAICYLIFNILENYVLTPKLLGDNIGIHPIVTLTAIFIAANIGGLMAIALAIPLVGIVQILLLRMTRFYKNSNIYQS
jgi:putative permease